MKFIGGILGALGLIFIVLSSLSLAAYWADHAPGETVNKLDLACMGVGITMAFASMVFAGLAKKLRVQATQRREDDFRN